MVNRVGSSPLKVEQVGEEILCREGNPLSDLRESKSQMSRLASSIWQNCFNTAKPAITEAAIRVAADDGPGVYDQYNALTGRTSDRRFMVIAIHVSL